MAELTYKCTMCDRVFPGIGAMATHIEHVHAPRLREDTRAGLDRKALDLPDEDEDELEDEDEDELLPSSPANAARRLEFLRHHAALFVAERNNAALEKTRDELQRLETHWKLCAEQLARQSLEASQVRRLAEWVLREAVEVVP